MGVEIKLDINKILKDFKTSENKLNNKLEASLDMSANLMRATQWSILRSRVITWTGNLANSIEVKKTGRFSREIGPVGVIYDKWIEYGGKGNFFGYHYVGKSFKKHHQNFVKRIKNDVKNAL